MRGEGVIGGRKKGREAGERVTRGEKKRSEMRKRRKNYRTERRRGGRGGAQKRSSDFILILGAG